VVLLLDVELYWSSALMKMATRGHHMEIVFVAVFVFPRSVIGWAIRHGLVN